MTSFNNLNSHGNNCSSLIYPHQHIPSSTFYDFHQHISLLTDTAEEQSRISLNHSQIISSISQITSTPRQSFITSTTTTTPTNFVVHDNREEENENNDADIDLNKWTVVKVGKFIEHLINHTIAEQFLNNDIDGQALVLLTEDHLMNRMGIKLGPAIKILNRIEELRKCR